MQTCIISGMKRKTALGSGNRHAVKNADSIGKRWRICERSFGMRWQDCAASS